MPDQVRGRVGVERPPRQVFAPLLQQRADAADRHVAGRKLQRSQRLAARHVLAHQVNHCVPKPSQFCGRKLRAGGNKWTLGGRQKVPQAVGGDDEELVTRLQGVARHFGPGRQVGRRLVVGRRRRRIAEERTDPVLQHTARPLEAEVAEGAQRHQLPEQPVHAQYRVALAGRVFAVDALHLSSCNNNNNNNTATYPSVRPDLLLSQ